MGGGGGGSLMSGRGAADALARMTSIAGGFFLVTSLGLTALSGAQASTEERSVFDLLPRQEQTAPATPAPLPAEPTRPDPTESSLPTEAQLASLEPQTGAAVAPAVAVAPPPAAAAERAAPLQPQAASLRPQPSAATPRQTTTTANTQARPPTVRPPAQPAVTTTNVPRATNPPTQRSQAISTNPTAPASRPPALVLPNTSGAATEPAQAPGAESVDAGNGVEAVRRERAGPDQ